MIIKSNSQALGGGMESKTTTKKSPKGLNLDKINALKEAMNHVSIQAKMPSSTTNKSVSNIFNNKDVTSSFGTIGIKNGPIKIKVSNGQKSGGNSTAKKSKGVGSSSKKGMQVSRTVNGSF